MRRLLTVFALLMSLAAAGCGGQSAAEKLLLQRKGYCEASIDTTVGALSQPWGYLPNVIQCGSTLLAPNGHCDPNVIQCRLLWKEIVAIDSSICGTSGCAYQCEAFAPQPAAGLPSTPADMQGQVICSARFAQGQPSF